MPGGIGGQTMYLVPYLMAPPGSPPEEYAAGVELTEQRTVVLHMIRMARVGVEFVEDLADPNSFERTVHVTGGLENLGRTPRRISATSSPLPTNAPSCITDRPTAATRCSARSPTACARPPTTAEPRASSSPNNSCCSALQTRRPVGPTTSAVASRAPRARPTWR